MKIALAFAFLLTATCFMGCSGEGGGAVGTAEEIQQYAVPESAKAEIQAQMEEAEKRGRAAVEGN